MNDFTFCSPTRFVFGKGATDRVGNELADAGLKRVLLVYGQGSVERTGVLARVRDSLATAGIEWRELGGVRPNPEVGLVRTGIEDVCAHPVDGILAVGGGSVIDAAKAVAFGALYDGDVWDFFTRKLPVSKSLPLACVLTIPAAGSEASSSCVINNDEFNRKVGVNGDCFRPRIAVMDPELTFTLPAYHTAAGVTDMVAHICERYFSGVGPVPVTDNIATGLIRALMEAAPAAIANPCDYDARANIMWAGMLAHNDLAGCGRSLGAGRAGGWESHALEHELSAHHPDIVHGAGLAVIMPAWMRYVWCTDPARFLSFAKDVFGIEPIDDTDEAVGDAVTVTIDELQNFFVEMGMPSTLTELGVGEGDFDTLIETLRESKGTTFGAFKPLTLEDARAIYRSAL